MRKVWDNGIVEHEYFESIPILRFLSLNSLPQLACIVLFNDYSNGISPLWNNLILCAERFPFETCMSNFLARASCKTKTLQEKWSTDTSLWIWRIYLWKRAILQEQEKRAQQPWEWVLRQEPLMVSHHTKFDLTIYSIKTYMQKKLWTKIWWEFHPFSNFEAIYFSYLMEKIYLWLLNKKLITRFRLHLAFSFQRQSNWAK